MKQETFTYGKYSYQYYLVKQDRKTVSLVVQPSLKIVLKCPIDYEVEKIERFLKKKWNWLERQLKHFQKYKKTEYKKEYVSGESFLYLGRQYKLIVAKAKEASVSLTKGQIHIFTPKPVNDGRFNKKLLEKWYEERTLSIFKKQLKETAKRFNYDCTPQLIIRKMNKRWGSYLQSKKIILNPELIKASKDCIDYVITHELCHIMHKKHDKNFFKMMDSKIPHWEKVKEKLELRFI
ncbi:M48 family metallopeptidase [bacterium]|nr:M48 family metallopeptidase [bacterium]